MKVNFYLLSILIIIHSDNLRGQDHNIQESTKAVLSEIFSEVEFDINSSYIHTLDLGDFDNDDDLDLIIHNGWSTSRILENRGGVFELLENVNIRGNHHSKWGEFNNDGHLDIYNGSSVLLNFENQEDSLQSRFDSVYFQFDKLERGDVSFADFNRDGKLDIVRTGIFNDGDPIVQLYKNDGNGFILKGNENIKGTIDGSVDAVDIDRDGLPDILISGTDWNNNGYTRIYKNIGDFKFELLDLPFPNSFHASSYWADINRDGFEDLFLKLDQENSLYLNNSGSEFEKIDNTLPRIVSGSSLLVDYDNDGNLELILSGKGHELDPNYIAEYFTQCYEFENGLFRLTSDSIPPMNGTIAVWGDINNDNNIDLVFTGFPGIGNDVDRKSALYLNTSQVTNSPPSVPILGDPIVVSNSVKLQWFKSIDDFTPQESITYNVYIGSNPNFINILDPISNLQSGFHKIVQNGNAKYDTSFTITDLDTGIYYYAVQAIDNANNSSKFCLESSFQIKPPLQISNQSFRPIYHRGAVEWGDYDGDEDYDLLIAGSYYDNGYKNLTRIYKNDEGTFNEINTELLDFGSGNKSSQVSWFDLDSDNDLDLVMYGITELGYILKIYINQGMDSFFEKEINYTENSQSARFSIGDIDNDGDPDIILGRNTLINEDGDFQLKEIFENEHSILAINDIDNDADLDLFGNTSLFDNNSNYKFIKTENEFDYYSGGGPGSGPIGFSDIDNDGDLDLIKSGTWSYDGSQERKTTLYINENGEFLKSKLDFRAPLENLKFGDFNNDGYSDFLFSTNTTHISGINYGTGNVDFEEVKYDFGGLDGEYSWCDYDNDGDLDIIATGFGDSKEIKTNLYINNGDWPNSPPSQPSNLKSEKKGSGILLTWTEAHDPINKEEKLSYNIRIGTSKLDTDIISPMSNVETGFRRIPKLGNCGMNTACKLDTLSEGMYYWAVQGVDKSFKGGVWSEIDSFYLSVVRADFIYDTIVLGDSTTFRDISISQFPITAWKWNFGNNDTSDQQNPIYKFSDPGYHSIQLIVNRDSFSDTITKNVLVLPPISASFQVDTVCIGEQTAINNTSFSHIDSIEIVNWYWDFGDGSNSTLNNPEHHKYLAPGSYIIKLTIESENGFIDSASQTTVIGSFPLPVISTNKQLNICSGDSIILSTEYRPSHKYTWYLDNALLSGADSSVLISTYSGNHRVEVTNMHGNCSSQSQTIIIRVNQTPLHPNIYNERLFEFCKNDSTILSVPYSEDYLYSWKLDGGVTGRDSSRIVVRNSGEYSVVVSTKEGCFSNSLNPVEIIVNDVPDKRNLSINGPTSFCRGDSLTIETDFEESIIYEWLNDDLVISGERSNNLIVKNSGAYHVRSSYNSECYTSSSIVNVIVHENPFAQKLIVNLQEASDQKYIICEGENVILGVDSEEVISRRWIVNNVSLDPQTEDYIVNSEGIYTAILLNAEGCETPALDSIQIKYKPALPKPEITAEGPSVWYLAASNDSASTYRWYHEGMLVEESFEHIYVANQNLGQYRVEITDDGECFTSSDIISLPDNVILTSNDLDPWENLKIYPNPTPGRFTLEMDNSIMGDLDIDIFTESGNRIINIRFHKETRHFLTEIDLSDQPAALYLIGLMLEDWKTTRRLIVE